MAGLINISSPYLNNPSITFEGVVDGSKSGLDLKRDIWIVVNGMIPSIPFSVDDIEIQPLTGGITNVLYLVTFASMTLKIIVRLFGAGTSGSLAVFSRNCSNCIVMFSPQISSTGTQKTECWHTCRNQILARHFTACFQMAE